MNYSTLILVITITLVSAWNDGVIKFSANDVDQLREILMNRRPTHRKANLGSFKYKNCGHPSTDLLVLSNLTLGPDPLSFPGSLEVSFKGEIKKTVDAPLKANVILKRKVGSGYIEIPCIGEIGSCNYTDLCDLLKGVDCPRPFVSNSIPCKCPFSQGTYTLPTTKFEVDAAVFPPGDYYAQANLIYKGAAVACVELSVSID